MFDYKDFFSSSWPVIMDHNVPWSVYTSNKSVKLAGVSRDIRLYCIYEDMAKWFVIHRTSHGE